MGISFDGFEDLQDTLVSLGLVGKREGKKALKEAGKIVLHQQIIDAPREDFGESWETDGLHGADFLSTTEVKTFSNGDQKLGVGITKDNWEQCKGLWFQNFGFIHWKSGEYIKPNVGWINESFAKCSKQAENKLVNEVGKAIDRYL